MCLYVLQLMYFGVCLYRICCVFVCVCVCVCVCIYIYITVCFFMYVIACFMCNYERKGAVNCLSVKSFKCLLRNFINQPFTFC